MENKNTIQRIIMKIINIKLKMVLKKSISSEWKSISVFV